MSCKVWGFYIYREFQMMNHLNYFIIGVETWILNTEHWIWIHQFLLNQLVYGWWMDVNVECALFFNPILFKADACACLQKNKANFWFVSQIFISEITIILQFQYSRMWIVNCDCGCWISKDFQSLTIRNGLSSDCGDDVVNACFWQYDKIIWMNANWR